MLVPGPVTTRCPRGPRGLLTRAAVVAEAAERNPEASGRSSEPLLGAERPPLLEGAVLSWSPPPPPPPHLLLEASGPWARTPRFPDAVG